MSTRDLEGDMTSHRSPAAPPLEDDNLISEILLRLPPEPSSLPRSSPVNKAWRRVASDPGFSQRFRLHHRRNPPLLGFFNDTHFVPTMDPPNRVPEGRVSLPLGHDHGEHLLLGCRHGLVLVLTLDKPTGHPDRVWDPVNGAQHPTWHPTGHPVLVWDPVTGEQHQIAVPAAFNVGKMTSWIAGAVVRCTGSGFVQFQVVLLLADRGIGRILAWFYSSETGAWGDPITRQLPYMSSIFHFRCFVCNPAVLVGGSLYWLLLETTSRMIFGNSSIIIKFDLDKQTLAVIPVPDGDRLATSECLVLQPDGAGLGFLTVLGSKGQLWNMKTHCHGDASWTLERTIEFKNLLLLNPETKEVSFILGFAEHNNVLLVETRLGLFTIQLHSWKFKKLLGAPMRTCYHALETVYAAGMGIGGGQDGAERLHNT